MIKYSWRRSQRHPELKTREHANGDRSPCLSQAWVLSTKANLWSRFKEASTDTKFIPASFNSCTSVCPQSGCSARFPHAVLSSSATYSTRELPKHQVVTLQKPNDAQTMIETSSGTEDHAIETPSWLCLRCACKPSTAPCSLTCAPLAGQWAFITQGDSWWEWRDASPQAASVVPGIKQSRGGFAPQNFKCKAQLHKLAKSVTIFGQKEPFRSFPSNA